MRDRARDARRRAPSAERNKEPILAVLAKVLPARGTVLEVASGTGQHAAYFAPRLAPRYWQPSDPDLDQHDSIAAWAAEADTDRLLPVMALDVRAPVWPVENTVLPAPVTAIVAINMIHIAPWAACQGLMAGAGRLLPGGGVLCLYGPFAVDGEHSAPSNAAFDASLRARDPAWGVRDLADVTRAAAAAGLAPAGRFSMPANNLMVVFTGK